MFFDFFDGFAARLLKVSSPIGKELDSLADMVTFGVLPAIIMFQLIGQVSTGNIQYIAFLVAIFSALRLAKFNTDDRQTDVFIGLPTPANALFLSALVFVVEDFSLLNNPMLLASLATLFALFLVMPLELFALKFKNYTFKDNAVRYIFLLVSIVLIIVFKIIALPIIVILYLVISILVKWLNKQ